jgi:hypothetical protein
LQKYQVYKDPYSGVMRLDLYQFDGTPMNPMYIAYTPPLMLPTQTMNPTESAGATATGKVKRSLEEGELDVPLNKNAKHIKRDTQSKPWSIDMLWWAGVGMIIFGGTAYML